MQGHKIEERVCHFNLPDNESHRDWPKEKRRYWPHTNNDTEVMKCHPLGRTRRTVSCVLIMVIFF